MLTPDEYDDVIVTVAHPYADIETTLRGWIETGPGPRRFVTITAARRTNGDPVPLEAIPLQYRNSPEVGGFSGSARLTRLGVLRQMMNDDCCALRHDRMLLGITVARWLSA